MVCPLFLNSGLLEAIGGNNSGAPGVRDVSFGNNIVEHSEVSIKIDKGSVGVLRRGNIFNAVSNPVLDLSSVEE